MRKGYVALRLSEAADDASAHGARRSIESVVNDRGRFPQDRFVNNACNGIFLTSTSRPASTFGTQRTSPSPPDGSPRTEVPGSREHLSDVDNRPRSLSDTRQFKRIHVIRPQQTLHNLGVSEDSLEDYCELHIAANNGAHALVTELLDRGEDVNASLPSGYTALHLASSNGHTRVVELLLDYGAAIDAVAQSVITPLARAVARRHIETAALLLARGAIVDAPTSLQAVVLRAAARADNFDVVRMLLYLGLDVNTYSGGERALYPAVFFGNIDLAEVLLQNGADPNAPCTNGYTPLSLAASRGDIKAFELLSMYVAAIAPSPPSVSEQIAREHLLHCAITGGSRTIVTTVMQHTGIDVNVQFRDGSTPLSLALESRRGGVVQLLLTQGADVYAEALPSKCFIRKEGSRIAEHAAAYGGHVQVVEIRHTDSHCIKSSDGECIAHTHHRCGKQAT